MYWKWENWLLVVRREADGDTEADKGGGGLVRIES